MQHRASILERLSRLHPQEKRLFLKIGLNNPLNLPLRSIRMEEAPDQFCSPHDMQLPPIDRTPNLRPVAESLASMAPAKVIPVAAVNQIASPTTSIEPTPSVINLVGQNNKSNTGEGVYTSVSDPTRRGSEAATAEKDWTIQRPKPEKVEDPPPPPLSQVLMDHIKSLWLASASAVQVQQQVKDQLEASQPRQNALPSVQTSEALTYSPSKINKTENI